MSRLREPVPVSHGFPPVCGEHARVLILGSLPGRASLAARQYYAQPQNAFWRIMGELFGAGPDLPYVERLVTLRARGVAVWDVLASGRRPGSLDSAIDVASAAPNDFQPLFDAQPGIRRICFNGAKAAELYRRFVLPGLREETRRLERLTLPSTSPAHTARSFAQKLALWRAALADVL
ncbi:MAG TPA: DNA-deoxyinosine glycosylase [Gammaproteobacteria bacterium]